MTTLLLNNFNGSDGATTFIDEVLGVSWSRDSVGAANELDTAIKKFGTASWHGLGAADDPTTRGSGFTFPASGSFTLEAFLAITTVAATGSYVAVNLVDNGNVAWAGFGIVAGGGQNDWFFDVFAGSLHSAFAAAGFATNTMYHFALVRDADADTYSCYVNGSRVAQWSDSANLAGTVTKVEIQGTYSGSGSGIGGWIDSVRLTDEVKYSGTTYTVPTAEFTLTVTGSAAVVEIADSAAASATAWPPLVGSLPAELLLTGAMERRLVGSLLSEISLSGLAAQQGMVGALDLAITMSSYLTRPDPLRFAARRAFRDIRATPESFKRIKAVASPGDIIATVDR